MNSISIDDLTDQEIDKILHQTLSILITNNDLSYEQMHETMLLIMQGKCSDTLLSAILVALRMKGESIDEITAAASVMRELSIKITPTNHQNLIDIVGTGGDGSNLFNVSTASAIVASCSGAAVAKHGNRSVSSKSGSSDLLEKANIRLDLTCDQTSQCIENQNLGFLFAPNHHPAIRHAMPVRRSLGIRTLFNILGPLTNPAGAKKAVIGVFDHNLCEPLAHVFNKLGDEHIIVVGSNDGLDEISITGKNKVAELKNGIVNVYTITPEDFGLKTQSLDGLRVSSSEESLELITQALSPKDSTKNIEKARNMIALNAGAAIYVSGVASNIDEGVKIAQSIINSGSALIKLTEFASFTQNLK